jgi:hypothetical protein
MFNVGYKGFLKFYFQAFHYEKFLTYRKVEKIVD